MRLIPRYLDTGVCVCVCVLSHYALCTIAVSGPTSSGKSILARRILKHRHTLMRDAPDVVVWCYGVWQNSMHTPIEQDTSIDTGTCATEQATVLMDIQYVQGIPTEELLDSYSAKGPILLVLDDLMSDVQSSAKDSKRLSDLFTMHSHHRNISCLYLLQNLFPRSQYSRKISLNAHYIFLLKNSRDRAQIRNLAQQVYPGRHQFLVQAYEDATRTPYTYLLLDFTSQCPEEYRVRVIVE